MGHRLHGVARRAEQIELNRSSCAEVYARALGPLREHDAPTELTLAGGTEGSNPLPSSGESIANLFELEEFSRRSLARLVGSRRHQHLSEAFRRGPKILTPAVDQTRQYVAPRLAPLHLARMPPLQSPASAQRSTGDVAQDRPKPRRLPSPRLLHRCKHRCLHHSAITPHQSDG
jgi:hypothetical protein